MSRSIRSMTVAATVASALTLAPAALAGGGVTPDNRADRTGPAGLGVAHQVVTPDNRADRTGPAGVKAANPDTTGVGLIHASMVYAEVAARNPASTDTGFDWADAGIGAAFGVVLTAAGIAAGTRSRRREVAA